MQRAFQRTGGLLGLILASSLVTISVAQEQANDELVGLVIDLLSDQDKDIRALGLEQVRTQAPGAAATERFAEQLPKLPSDGQVGLLRALTERGDATARSAVLGLLAKSQDESVRIAAIEALGALGNQGDLPDLVLLLGGRSSAEQAAARSSLIRLGGEATPAAIASTMQQSDPPVHAKLIEILAERRALETIPQILSAAVDAASEVRSAAMAALAELAGPEQIPGMLQGVLRAERGRERDAAEKSVMRVCQRIQDPNQQAVPALEAMNQLARADRTALLPMLGRIGGPAAREAVEAAIASRDAATHEMGLRALCNWPNATVAPRLIELAKTDSHSSHQIAAVRALIRIAPLPDDRSDSDRLELLRQAMSMSRRAEERNLVIRRAQAIRTPETLRFVLPYVSQPAHAAQACETVVELAHHRGLREANKAEFDRALDQVIATTKNPTIIDRAQRYKKGQTWAAPISP